jgi:FtsH-binding integral membrane protein
MQTDASPWGKINTVADASVDERAAFIVKTYVHLAGAVFAFVAIETVLFFSGVAHFLLGYMTMPFAWLAVMAGFIGVSWIANSWARNATSLPMQYAGLGLYVAAESVLFVPMIALALHYDTVEGASWAGGILGTSAIVTVLIFGGLTGIVFVTRKDFSFMKGVLGVCALGAFATIVCSILFGFSLGVFFSGAMVVLAGGYVLYYTSNVMHHYRTDQPVAAALALFSAVALLFWYVLRIFMSSRR